MCSRPASYTAINFVLPNLFTFAPQYMNTLFAEYTPAAQLLPYVHSYWTGSFNVEKQKAFSQTVLPNGCIELIIHTGTAHCRLAKDDGIWVTSPRFTLLGLYENAYEVKFDENVTVFGIRFYPDGIYNTFAIPPATFTATYENSFDVLGSQFEIFCTRLADAKETGKQVKLVDEYLAKQLGTNKKACDYAHHAMQLVRNSRGVLTPEQLAKETCISPRQLQRSFKAVYGITPRDYIRLARINTIHNYMLAGNQNLSSLSYEMNFADQSHFIKEYRTFTGIAPKKFLKHRENFIVNPVNI